MTRLLAFDTDDLGVMSAHLESAKVMRGNMTYLPKDKRFVLVAERTGVDQNDTARLTGLHFERVDRVMTHHLGDHDAATPLVLIGIAFETTQAPSGHVVLMFEDQRAIRLDVECLEAVLADLPMPADMKVQ